MNYTVGQTLWLVPEKWALVKDPQEITIDKVGRKWAEYVVHGTRYRVEIGTNVVDGGKYGSPGTLWPDKAAWKAHTDLADAWADFQRRLTHNLPKGLTLANLEAVKKLLGLG